MMRVRWGILACLCSLATSASAQNVRRDSLSGYGSSLRVLANAAETQGRADWPHPPDMRGTAVQLTFDAQNADVTLVAPAGYGLPRLLDDARAIAAKAGFPRADFITTQGTHTIAADIELNKYLTRRRFATDFTFPLGRLARACYAL